MKTSLFRLEDFGIKRGKLADLVGADKDANARITLSILNGEKGSKRDVVLMNSSAALVVAGKAKISEAERR